MKFHLTLLFSLSILLAGCYNNKRRNENGFTATDSLAYITLPDTQVTDPSWPDKNEVVVHIIAEPDNLHPTNGTTSIRGELQFYTQMYLVQTDMRSPGIRPGLCRSLPEVSENGTRLRFELREGPRWDDGSPITADDVLFTIKANKCPFTLNPSAKPYWGNVIDASASGMEITVTMKEPYVQNVAFWSDFPVMQRSFHDADNVLASYTVQQFDSDSTGALAADAKLSQWAAGFNDQKYGFEPAYLNGAGPYRVEKWEPGQMIVLKKKENHWSKGSDDYMLQANPERIIYKINRDGNAQLLDFKSQAFDASAYISAKTLFDLRQDAEFNKNYHSRFIDTYGYTYIAMNMRPDGIKRKKIFDDVKVRRAMAMLTPVDDVIRVVNKGINKRVAGPVSLLKEEYANLPLINVNVKEAVKMLNDAGWNDSDGDNILDKTIDGRKTPFSFQFNYLTTQAEWKDMADIICESYAKAGIQAVATPLDQGAFFSSARDHDFDMMMGSWATNSLGEDFTQVWHTSSWTSNGSNYPGFGNAESDSLIERLRTTISKEERRPMIIAFQKMVYDEQPYVFLYALVRRNILHKRWGHAEMYYDRPGMLYNGLTLLRSPVTKDAVIAN